MTVPVGRDSVPRVAPGRMRDVGPAAWVFARVAGLATGTSPPALFLSLGRTKGLFWGWLHFAGRLMPGGKLPRRETELVIVRVAHLRDNRYELSHHEHLGRRAGVTPEELERLSVGPDAPGWTDRERALLRAVDQMHAAGDVEDSTWEELRRHLDERQAIELCMLAGHYEMLATVIQTLRIQPDERRRH